MHSISSPNIYPHPRRALLPSIDWCARRPLTPLPILQAPGSVQEREERRDKKKGMELYVVRNCGVVFTIGAGIEYVLLIDDANWECVVGSQFGGAEEEG